MFFGGEKSLIVVLTVNINQLTADFTKHGNRNRCTVEAADILALPTECSIDYQYSVLAVDSVLVEKFSNFCVNVFKNGINLCTLCSRSDNITGSPLAENSVYRINDY